MRGGSRNDWFDVRTPHTGMGKTEALELVLRIARGLEYDSDFDWTPDHTEACDIVDGVLNKLLGEE